MSAKDKDLQRARPIKDQQVIAGVPGNWKSMTADEKKAWSEEVHAVMVRELFPPDHPARLAAEP